MERHVEAILLCQMTDDDAASAGALLAAVWPKPEKDAAYRATELLRLGQGYSGDPEVAPRSFLVRDDGGVVAHALASPRRILLDGREQTILALAKVAVDPQRRGEHLGEKVAKAAFSLVDDGLYPFALFQTSERVRSFYVRLGATPVENRIIDSTSATPNTRPFWDDVVMRYPSDRAWPTGQIDLLGPGY